MKLPSDAQARLLPRIAELDQEGREVFWKVEQDRARAAIFYELEDRERNVAYFEHLWRIHARTRRRAEDERETTR